MDLTLTEEQRELQRMTRQLFAKDCPISFVRADRDGEGAAEMAGLWSSLADAGLLGLSISDAFGGSGGSLIDLSLVVLEAGRSLCPRLYTSTLLFGMALDRAGTESQKERWLPAVTEGRLRAATVGPSKAAAGSYPDRVRCRRTDTGWALAGHVDVAFAPITSDVLFIRASDGTAPAQFVVPSDAPGITAVRHDMLGTSDYVSLDLANVLVDDMSRLVTSAKGSVEPEWLEELAACLPALEAIGGASAVLERTSQYVSHRVQFDRPIGTFQAVQHQVANMKMAVDGGWLAAMQAMCALNLGRPAARETAIAAAWAVHTFKTVAFKAHQLHGGIGITLEDGLHLWTERAKLLELASGSRDVHVQVLADAMRIAR